MPALQLPTASSAFDEMKKVLQIIVRPGFPREHCADLSQPDSKENDAIEFLRFDLRKDDPDYDALVEAIFTADAAHVW